MLSLRVASRSAPPSGLHWHKPGRIEPESPIALTTSLTEALQARRSCASSLDTFTQSFLHRAWPKTRGPEIGSRSALIVVAHVFSWPPARLHHVRGGVGRRRSLISSPSERLSAFPNQRSLLCTSSAGMLVRQRRCNWTATFFVYVLKLYYLRSCWRSFANSRKDAAHFFLIQVINSLPLSPR